MRFRPVLFALAAFAAGSMGISQAQACSCLAPVEAFPDAESVFVGQVLSTEKCNPKKHGLETPQSDRGFFGRITRNMFKSYTCYRVAVVDRLRGEIGERIEVVGKTNPEGAACEAGYMVGQHVLFLERGTGPYWANMCSSFGVGKDDALLKDLEAAHGVTFDIEGVYKTETAPAADEGS